MTPQRRWARWLAGALLLAACGVDAVGAIPDSTHDGSPDGAPGPGTGSSSSSSGNTTPDANNVDLDGTTPDASDGGVDAPVDAPADVEDAMVDGGDAAVDAPVDAAFDAGVTFDCNGQQRASCAGCPNKPLPCYMCKKGGGAPATLCVAAGSSCIQILNDNDYDWCPCDYPVGAKCPLREQVCHQVQGGSCVTCGENLTNGYQCKEATKKCNQPQSKCE